MTRSNRASMLNLVSFLRPYSFYAVIALLGAAGQIAADLLQPWPLKLVFDSIFSNKPLPPLLSQFISLIFGAGSSGALYFALAAVLMIAVTDACSSFLQDMSMARVGHNVLHDLRRALYWHIQRLSLAYHDQKRTGDLITTLTSDIQVVQDLIESALTGIVINALTLIGMIVIMLLLDWRFTLLALSIAPLLFVVVYRFTRRIKQESREVRRQEGKVASIAQEVLSSIRLVQAFTREDYEQARFEQENRERVSAGIRVRTLQAELTPLVEVLVALGTVLALWYGVREVFAGQLTPGALLVFLAYLAGVYRPMRNLSKLSDIVSRAAVGSERIFGVLATERSVRDYPNARAAPRFQGHIEFAHVSFGYRRGEYLLKDISLRIRPGQMVALVGSTGAGKTTLMSLIPRFHDPAQGQILIDGTDIRQYTLNSLREQISLVLQETVLFHGTVTENIAYGQPEASFDQIRAAAKAANADEFIQSLPAGYETIIGERGVTLSGGQRQRIAIARAIIRDAPVVLLDEPTTGLDASSEALVMQGLTRLLAGRAALVIGHRLTTVSRADLILVLENGRIVEQGTHQELLSGGGRYAELYQLQFAGQAPMVPDAAR